MQQQVSFADKHITMTAQFHRSTAEFTNVPQDFVHCSLKQFIWWQCIGHCKSGSECSVHAGILFHAATHRQTRYTYTCVTNNTIHPCLELPLTHSTNLRHCLLHHCHNTKYSIHFFQITTTISHQYHTAYCSAASTNNYTINHHSHITTTVHTTKSAPTLVSHLARGCACRNPAVLPWTWL